ncbi:hypothetical protein CCACVL1_18289, partial [Corchorus capsularis]
MKAFAFSELGGNVARGCEVSLM